MNRLSRRALGAWPCFGLLMLAACAQNPAEPARGLAEATRFATPATKMPDFVTATRPAVLGDYMPVGVDAPPRPDKAQTTAAQDATRKALESEAKANQSALAATPKPR